MSQNTRKQHPLESIRKFCVACMGGSYLMVAQCPETACPLHGYRMGSVEEGVSRPPVRAVRRQCLACCCEDRERVRACSASPACKPPFEPCPLWRFRLGSRPEIFERRKRKARRTLLVLPGLTLDKNQENPAP
ncbi:hypothetical protein NNJEOMEG_02908 [Fundidesulfovibrio magnetotacticus]|uniref:Uncharacterized protein n=1 Tax=Fundidesulfovibrio magnetotacticus TaxID=2730080 RepID=A0A6V8M3L1_9BACT|nr:restriction endonuclease [Fundidesulfovibrio magnetotacticus]GFK95055.1 hypothetical protein NNJEOMEG_02908 [Fundidesulfovibrio magnetotacticus]